MQGIAERWINPKHENLNSKQYQIYEFINSQKNCVPCELSGKIITIIFYKGEKHGFTSTNNCQSY